MKPDNHIFIPQKKIVTVGKSSWPSWDLFEHAQQKNTWFKNY